MSKPLTSHTPGPWRVETYLDEVDQCVRTVVSVPTEYTHENKNIAHIATWGGWMAGNAEAQANARLIAAAPELLAALRACADYLGEQTHALGDEPRREVQAYIAARAAIAKAEGRKEVA